MSVTAAAASDVVRTPRAPPALALYPRWRLAVETHTCYNMSRPVPLYGTMGIVSVELEKSENQDSFNQAKELQKKSKSKIENQTQMPEDPMGLGQLTTDRRAMVARRHSSCPPERQDAWKQHPW